MDARLKLLSTVSWCSRPIPGERMRSLLRTLAEAGSRGCPADALIDAIWSEALPDHPSKALQILVSRTRAQTSAEAIERTAVGYRLALAAEDVDLWTLESLTVDAEAALRSGDTSRALELTRRAMTLTDLGHDLGEESLGHDYETRTRLVLALALSRRGRHREALPELARLRESNLFDEELAVEYLRAVAGVEGPAAALSAFSKIRDRLRKELGSDPGARLQTFHRELLTMDKPVRAGLQYAATSFLGREVDIEKVGGLLSTVRLVTILGPGGLGKTRLAQELAARSTVPNIHVVELATIRRTDEVMGAVADALQVRESISRIDRQSPVTDLRSRVIAQLRAGPNLLVIDNCEHLIDGVAGLVSDLLSTVPDLRILTTSRAPLRLTAEHTYPLDQLPAAEAALLFTQRARAVRPSMTLDPDVAAELVDRLDGLPLAIELAAARTRTLSPEDILDNVARRFELLRGGDRSAPARHQTLQAVIDWSWQLLDENSRCALMTMSLLPDAFSTECAESILGRSSMSAGALMTIDDLVDQSLLTVVERHGQIRFRMLETIREYGFLKLAEFDLTAQAHTTVEEWAISTCEALVPDILGPEQMRAVAALRPEELNLMHVLRRLFDRVDDGVVVMLAALLPYWMVSGEHIHIVTHFEPIERFLTAWTMPEDLTEMTRRVLAVETTTWGMLPRWKDLPEARRLLERLGPDSDDAFIRAMSRLGLAISRAPEPEESTSSGHSPEDIARIRSLTESEDHFTRLLALPFLAGITENAGEVATSIALLEGGITSIGDEEPPWLSTRYRESLSQLHLQYGNFAQALEHARIALPILAGFGDTVECRSVLAFAQLNLGRLDAAEAELDALAEVNDHEEPFGHRYMLMLGRAELCLMHGQIEDALVLLETAQRTGRARASLPGLPKSDGLDPWSLLIWAESTVVWARHSPDEAEDRFNFLLDKAERGAAPGRGHYDFPVLGGVAFALAASGHLILARLGRGALSGRIDEDQVIRLMALARRLDYNRAFPSLSWHTLADELTTEQTGQLDSLTQELSPLGSAEVIRDFHKCVRSISRAGTT